MKTIFDVIDYLLDIIAELKLKDITLEVDQGIYSNILDAIFKMEDDRLMIFDKIISKQGSFCPRSIAYFLQFMGV